VSFFSCPLADSLVWRLLLKSEEKFFLSQYERERHMQDLVYRLGQRQEKKDFGIHCQTSAGSSCGTEVKIFQVQMWFA